MDKLKVNEAIIVEGRYDANAVRQIVDGVVIETRGFGVFKDGETLELIRRMARRRGVIILTDGDGAGFVIRNFLKGALGGLNVRHAYIPDIAGKEGRKKAPSAEGKLGVEGMSAKLLREAIIKSGATREADGSRGRITKAELYAAGLSGGVGSAEKRKKLKLMLGLPERLGANALLDVLNAAVTCEEFQKALSELQDSKRRQNG